MQVDEALCAGDKAAASRIAQQTLQRFEGQELGLMPYLRKVAAGEV
ncbi:MAG: hypothetical protein H6730_06430 [Deltaproteobacteria bacterium]|nr:hypothetical protein [Deltaproteobacteria bacterium]